MYNSFFVLESQVFFVILFNVFIYIYLTLFIFFLLLSQNNNELKFIKNLSIVNYNNVYATSIIFIFLSFAGIPPFAGFLGKFSMVYMLFSSFSLNVFVFFIVFNFFVLYFYIQNFKFFNSQLLVFVEKINIVYSRISLTAFFFVLFFNFFNVFFFFFFFDFFFFLLKFFSY